MNGRSVLLLCAAAVTGVILPPSAFPDSPVTGPIVREERTVTVGHAVERWRLEWAGSPSPVCGPEDEDWYTCPCWGFAFGERGVMELVRQRNGAPDERFPLAPLFRLSEGPVEWERVEAAIPKWPVADSDLDHRDDKDFSDRVHQRQPVSLMNVADFDHDGWATEFVLQVGAGPCGHEQGVLVGVSRQLPELHAFGTAEHPDMPLVLELQSFQRLLKSRGEVSITEWPFGDHGSGEENVVQLRTDSEGIHATRIIYQCDESGKRTKLASKKVL